MKRKKRNRYGFGGFTLIELLVALVISSIIISSLLGFMVNILTTDRREQAKTNSELELQSAINYIARDLRQAVYIYDGDALVINHSDAGDSGIRDQIPPVSPTIGCNDANICRPVLVFWKRELMEDVIPVGDSGYYDDTFVYSLVGYYLIKDDSDTWSGTARIARFQIKDGAKDAGVYITDPDDGFGEDGLTKILSGTDTLREKMNRWEKGDGDYTSPAQILVDYIDHSDDATKIPAPNASTPGDGSTIPTAYPPTTKYADFCEDILPTNYTDDSGAITYQAQLVPNYDADSFPDELKTGSFYACVDSLSTQAKVFLRGNALARFNSINNAEYEESQSQFFPTTSLRVQGRGILGE